MYQIFIDAIKENLRSLKNVEAEGHIAKLVPAVDELDMGIHFIDRDVTLTLSRVYRSMSPLEKLKMLWYFRSAMLTFSSEKREKSIHSLEEHDDLVGGVVENLAKFAPKVAEEAKDERTEYLAKKIFDLSKDGKTVAILPDSKLEDVEERISSVRRQEIMRGKHSGFEHLEDISKRIYFRLLRYSSSIFFISLAIYLFFFSDVLNVWRAWLYWFLAVGGMSAFGALLARGHPLSILVSFILAPFMSLTLIGPGWIAGYIELRVRNPKVKDLRELTGSKSIGEFISNNFIKVFLVGTFSNIFTWIGLFILLPILISFVG